MTEFEKAIQDTPPFAGKGHDFGPIYELHRKCKFCGHEFSIVPTEMNERKVLDCPAALK
jgi:hypothetical protein